MAQTVAECLTAGIDSVTVIDGVKAGSWDVTGMTQAEINEMVQRNVDHLEIILAYDGTDDSPNITGSSNSKKGTCNTAVTTGKAYIASNS
jgi:hypothetical protein